MTKVKTVKVVASKALVNKIINEYMIQANKTEIDKQIEEMTMQIEDNTIECQAIIAALQTSDLPTALLKKGRAELELAKAIAAYEKSRFMPGTLADCIQKRNEAKSAISGARFSVEFAISAIAEVEKQITEYTSVLADLQVTV